MARVNGEVRADMRVQHWEDCSGRHWLLRIQAVLRQNTAMGVIRSSNQDLGYEARAVPVALGATKCPSDAPLSALARGYDLHPPPETSEMDMCLKLAI
jgi:hypothetical protein